MSKKVFVWAKEVLDGWPLTMWHPDFPYELASQIICGPTTEKPDMSGPPLNTYRRIEVPEELLPQIKGSLADDSPDVPALDRFLWRMETALRDGGFDRAADFVGAETVADAEHKMTCLEINCVRGMSPVAAEAIRKESGIPSSGEMVEGLDKRLYGAAFRHVRMFAGSNTTDAELHDLIAITIEEESSAVIRR